MPFVQKKLEISLSQTRDIFDKFVYKPDNGDALADVLVSGYFSDSRFVSDESVVEAELADGYFYLSVDNSGTATVIDLAAGSGVQSVTGTAVTGGTATDPIVSPVSSDIPDNSAVGGADVEASLNLLNSAQQGLEAPTDTAYARQGNTWMEAYKSTVTFRYMWSTDTVNPPGVGEISADNTDLALLTELRISTTVGNGASTKFILEKLKAGDSLYGVVDQVDTSYGGYTVNGDPVDNGTYFTVPVSAETVGTNPSDGQMLILGVIATGEKIESLQEGFLIDITDPDGPSPTIGVGLQFGSNITLNTATTPDTLDSIDSYVNGVSLSIPSEDILRIDLTRNNGLSTLTDTVDVDALFTAGYTRTQDTQAVKDTFEAMYLSVFPEYFDQIEAELIDSQTYPGTPQLEIVTPADMPSGMYQFSFSLTVENPDANDSLYCQFTGDAPTQEFVIEAKDTSDIVPITFFTYTTLLAGTMTIGLQFRKEDAGANDIELNRATIRLKRCCP